MLCRALLRFSAVQHVDEGRSGGHHCAAGAQIAGAAGQQNAGRGAGAEGGGAAAGGTGRGGAERWPAGGRGGGRRGAQLRQLWRGGREVAGVLRLPPGAVLLARVPGAGVAGAPGRVQGGAAGAAGAAVAAASTIAMSALADPYRVGDGRLKSGPLTCQRLLQPGWLQTTVPLVLAKWHSLHGWLAASSSSNMDGDCSARVRTGHRLHVTTHGTKAPHSMEAALPEVRQVGTSEGKQGMMKGRHASCCSTPSWIISAVSAQLHSYAPESAG